MGYINIVSQTGTKYKINDTKEIARGGEGCIFELGNDKVAKIYHPGIQVLDQAKFNFLKKLDKTLFIAPQELLYDAKHNVVGYSMEYLTTDFYPLSNLFTKSFCTAHNVDKKIKLKVIESLIKAVEYAHQMNVIIGDLNCFNIMVNNSGVIKLIDTDSYQTPGFAHSGRLLDDIRDYYYQGAVNNKSDCFALSILAFNLLSFTHPFKGIHKQHIKIADRMINKLPVFAKDPELKVPKCYEPINDTNLMGQFERFYIKGERFLISLSAVNANLIVVTMNQPSLVKKYEQNDLIITRISGDEMVKNTYCTDTRLIVETEKDFLVYDAKNKGYVSLLDTISKVNYDQIFVGNKNVILKKGKDLFVYNNSKNITKITSFVFPENYIIKQYENILVVIDYDNMYKLFLDDTLSGVIKTTTLSVFGKGFQNYQGLIYNAGGKQNIFYNAGSEMSSVSLPIKIQDMLQDKNIGIIQYVEKKEVKHKFFKIKNLTMSVSQNEIPGWANFAFRPDKDGEGFIFVPKDDKISIIRSQDFAEISELKCDLISTESVLKNTNSGLVLFEDRKVWLLNKK